MSSLLVIGNGFDLKIGAKTSYVNFFESDYYAKIKEDSFKLINSGEVIQHSEWQLYPMNIYECDFCCWDILFCLESKYRKIDSKAHVNWCDIEKVIHDSLIDYSAYNFSWKHVFEIMYGYYYRVKPLEGKAIPDSLANTEVRIMCYFLKAFDWKDDCKDESTFYNKLLEELKKFEFRFGLYIRKQTKGDEYIRKARSFTKQLIGSQDSIWIDSFNYSDFSSGTIDIRHINGDCDDPIFGIDLTEKEELEHPEARLFTKTSRRVRQDSYNLNRNTKWTTMSIDKAVVFGHSLNEMDYDYFNYLFTLLKFNTFDIEEMGSIEFVYRIYDSNNADVIRNRNADSIYALLNYYEGYVSKSNQHILINLLRFSGKLSIKEIT